MENIKTELKSKDDEIIRLKQKLKEAGIED